MHYYLTTYDREGRTLLDRKPFPFLREALLYITENIISPVALIDGQNSAGRLIVNAELGEGGDFETVSYARSRADDDEYEQLLHYVLDERVDAFLLESEARVRAAAREEALEGNHPDTPLPGDDLP